MTDWSKLCPVCNQWRCVCLSNEQKQHIRQMHEAERSAAEAQIEREKQERLDRVCEEGREQFTEYERGVLRKLIERFDDNPEARTQRLQKAHEARVKEMIAR